MFQSFSSTLQLVQLQCSPWKTDFTTMLQQQCSVPNSTLWMQTENWIYHAPYIIYSLKHSFYIAPNT